MLQCSGVLTSPTRGLCGSSESLRGPQKWDVGTKRSTGTYTATAARGSGGEATALRVRNEYSEFNVEMREVALMCDVILPAFPPENHIDTKEANISYSEY